jgi:hypothetical protein
VTIKVGRRYLIRFGTQSVTGPLVEVLEDDSIIVASEQHNDAPMLALKREIVREIVRELPPPVGGKPAAASAEEAQL